MTLSDAAVIVGSLLGLGIAGWQFLDHSLYRDHEEKDPIVQVAPAQRCNAGLSVQVSVS
jgi:hypothetical protein